MTLTVGVISMRWLPGLGHSPGGVDFSVCNGNGTQEKAVTFAEALAVCILIDLWCTPSDLYASLRLLPPGAVKRGTP